MTWLCDLNDHRTALSFHNGSLGGICGGRSVGRESCQRAVVPGCNVTCRRSYTTRITSLLNITRWSLLHLFMDLTEISRMKIGLHPCYRQILQQLEHWRKRIKQKYPHIWAFVFHDKPTLPSHVPPKAKQRETCLLLRTSRMPTAPKKSRKQSLRVHEMFNNTSEQVARKLMTLWKLIWRSAFYTKLHLYL